MPIIREAEGVIRVACVGTLFGREEVTVWHYQEQGVGSLDQASAQSQVNRVRDHWQDDIMDGLPNDYTFVGLECLSLDSDVSFSFFTAPNGAKPLVGTQAGTLLPPNTCYLIHKVPTNAPRGFRPGRAMYGPPPEADADDQGILTSTVRTNRTNDAESFRTGTIGSAGGLDWHLVVPSWRNLPSPVPSEEVHVQADDVVEVASMSCDAKVATQRRRLRS